MKIGDLVVPKDEYQHYVPTQYRPGPDTVNSGIIIGFDHGDPIVFWDERFNEEHEYAHQLEVLNG